jgi:hypothetical protein
MEYRELIVDGKIAGGQKTQDLQLEMGIDQITKV